MTKSLVESGFATLRTSAFHWLNFLTVVFIEDSVTPYDPLYIPHGPYALHGLYGLYGLHLRALTGSTGPGPYAGHSRDGKDPSQSHG